jgi:hypothetical protein
MPPTLSVVVAICTVGVFSDDPAGAAGIWIFDGAILRSEPSATPRLSDASVVCVALLFTGPEFQFNVV